MTPRTVCTNCGQWWYEGQTPLCQHMNTEVSHEAEPPASQRGQEAYSELFAASDTILDWLKELHPRARPIARFNRLNDAIDRVREAHQMHGFDFAPVPTASPESLGVSQDEPKSSDPSTAWRGIASAPRDGTSILVFFSRTGLGVQQVSWTAPEWTDDRLWCVDDNKHGPYALRGYLDDDATHWMPLPGAPS